MEEEKKIENETFLDKFIKGANDSITSLENINRLILDDDNELENLIDNLLSKKKLSEQDERLLLEISSKLINLQEKLKNNKWEKIMKKLNEENEENEENRGQLRGGKKRKSSKRKNRKTRKTRKNKKSRKQKKRKSRKYK